MTLCAYEVDCDDILDLTETASLSAHEGHLGGSRLPVEGSVYPRDQAAILGRSGASFRDWNSRCRSPQLRQGSRRGQT